MIYGRVAERWRIKAPRMTEGSGKEAFSVGATTRVPRMDRSRLDRCDVYGTLYDAALQG